MPPKSVVSALQPLQPEKFTTSHHIGNPPTGFKNPWPSYNSAGFVGAIRTRFNTPKNFVPVPVDRLGLVPVRKPDFGIHQTGLKATWIGHASFLVETSKQDGTERGARILIDPVWSNRVGPYGRWECRLRGQHLTQAQVWSARYDLRLRLVRSTIYPTSTPLSSVTTTTTISTRPR